MDNARKLSTVRIAPRSSRWQSPGIPSLTVRVAAVLVALLAVVTNATAQGDGRGVQLAITDGSGRVVGGYRQSYALLIGVSDYTAGWSDLESVPSELTQVEKVLTTHGFEVTKRLNLDARAMEGEFEGFIRKYGYLEDARLLFYFSGHGHTRKEGRKGYLVPSDAPLPSRDEQAFLQKALPMSQILAWARNMEAKHALFMFDSCFSGTVFKQRSISPEPRHISRATALAVRQFITAGSAGEAVPAQSVFTPAFVDALKYGWGDLNGDGYVSGVELGLYLQAKVPEHVQQTPQFGKIRDYELSRGDFVFRLRESSPGLLVGHLKIMVNAADAKVYVEGEQVGVAQPQQPLKINDLSVGEHWVRVEALGYDSLKRKVEIRTDVLTQEVIRLIRLEPKTMLTVRSNVREDKVFIDGTYMGSTRLDLPLDPGRYTVRVEKEGFDPFEKKLDLRKDAVLWAKLTLPSEVIQPDPGQRGMDVPIVAPAVIPEAQDTPDPAVSFGLVRSEAIQPDPGQRGTDVAIAAPPVIVDDLITPDLPVSSGPVRIVLLPPNTRNLCYECDAEGEVSAVAGVFFRDHGELRLTHAYRGARLEASDLPYSSDYWKGTFASKVPNENAIYRAGNSTDADAALMYIYQSILTKGAWDSGIGRVHVYLFDVSNQTVHHREGTRNEMRKKTEEVMQEYLRSKAGDRPAAPRLVVQ